MVWRFEDLFGDETKLSHNFGKMDFIPGDGEGVDGGK